MEPKLIVESIEFNDGQKINLEPNAINIFVGANNVGKTAALKNIYNLTHVGGHGVTHKVIVNADLKKVGEVEDFVTFLRRVGHKTEHYPNYNFNIGHANYDIDSVGKTWESNDAKNFGNLFIQYMMTENRITHSNSIQSQDFSQEAPHHPIHFMYLDEKLENKISSFFKYAFNLDLIVDRFGGNQIYLRVGEKPQLLKDENHISHSYNSRIKELQMLKNQGDGMRSFVSILLEMISKNDSSLLIDEPEAFLHPPQARYLGKLIGKLFSQRQIFISTHSSDLIKGILESNNENVNLIRISRVNEFNSPSILNNNDIKEIWKDPVLRYSPIIDGLFHENVIICESDGDCRFFTAILESEFENDPRYYRISDTLFIPSHGKAKIPSIVKSLKKIAVPTFTICDFDIFNNISPLKELVDAHDGDWNLVAKKWQIFYNQVNQIKSQKDKEEAKQEIAEIFNSVDTVNLSHKDIEKVKNVLKVSTAWSFAKKSGISFIPSGEAHSACLEVIEYLKVLVFFLCQ